MLQTRSEGLAAPGIPERFILLALHGEPIQPRLLSSASSLCRRVDAGLDIMLISGESAASAVLEDFMREVRQEGVPCRLTRDAGMRCSDIVHYANTHECILTVLIDSLGNWAARGEDKSGDPWRKLVCPLVAAMPD
ncbi:MAG: hypothetical protein HY777_05890 [Betaproteobacteria bacterium]|nr:hypothetical protein [Betaproteobacteria bacterium]